MATIWLGVCFPLSLAPFQVAAVRRVSGPLLRLHTSPRGEHSIWYTGVDAFQSYFKPQK